MWSNLTPTPTPYLTPYSNPDPNPNPTPNANQVDEQWISGPTMLLAVVVMNMVYLTSETRVRIDEPGIHQCQCTNVPMRQCTHVNAPIAMP